MTWCFLKLQFKARASPGTLGAHFWAPKIRKFVVNLLLLKSAWSRSLSSRRGLFCSVVSFGAGELYSFFSCWWICSNVVLSNVLIKTLIVMLWTRPYLQVCLKILLWCLLLTNWLTADQKNAAASAEVILAEVFIVVVKFLLMSSVGVVCRLLMCTGCQCTPCIVIWKLWAVKLNCVLCWLRFIVYSYSSPESKFLLADWRMSNTEQFLEILLLLVCSLKDAGLQTDDPRTPYLPKLTTILYRLPTFYLLSQIIFRMNTKCL